MIYVTGDTHIPIDVKKLNTKNFPEQKDMTKNDFVIICGDFGGVWYFPESKHYKEDLYWLNWLTEKPFTTLFVDGNHENFPLLNSYPVIEKFGGKVGKITDSVFHLKRGEIYELCGKRFFCFGGAASHDKWHRVEGRDWWPEEMPNREEMQYGVDNLEKVGNKVDFIITHCCPTPYLEQVAGFPEQDSATQYLKFIDENVEFAHWYFGHYHLDKVVDDKHTCLYYDIKKIV